MSLIDDQAKPDIASFSSPSCNSNRHRHDASPGPNEEGIIDRRMSRFAADFERFEFSTRSADMIRTALTAGRRVHVGIVGAGFAGLRCADVLLKHGCKVTILEARDRVGGRVAQSNHLGHLVDLGPNWIHGTNNNPIMQLAKQTGTKLHAWEEEQALFDPSGDAIDAADAEEYLRLIWDDGLVGAAFRYSQDHADEIDPNRSLYDFFVEQAEELFKDEPSAVGKQKRKTLLQIASFWGAYVGSPVQRQSLKFYWLEDGMQGENPFVAETYSKIRDAVAKPALAGADIKYGAVVNEVRWPIDRSATSATSPAAEVQTRSGDIYEFDEVVITTPLGWLKRNLAAFVPALPARLAGAIGSIGYGTLDKVYISFPSAFWDEASQSANTKTANGLEPQGKAPNVTANTLSLRQQAQSDEDDLGEHWAPFSHWLAPSYASDTNPKQWDQAGVNLAALSKGCAQPTILFYIYGDCSKYIGELVTSTPESKERDAKLLAFFEPYFSRLPHFNAANPQCKPKAVLATAWAADEFAGYGSYSNFQIGLEEADKDIEAMREGLPAQGLWFAGEHTAPFSCTGTSTGAYWSGEGVAKRICRAYGIGIEEKETS